MPRLPALLTGIAAALASMVLGIPVSAAAATPFAIKLAFARFDWNGDGKLDPAELAAIAGERFQRIDRNRDGLLSREEFLAGRAAGAAERATADFARMDANRDGEVSRVEFVGDRQRQLIALGDSDGDGLISADELARIAAAAASEP